MLGAAIIITIALTYAELGAMFPESGGMVRYGHYSHGSLVGFVAAWANWISIVSVIPVEAEASVQYMASWPSRWAQDMYVLMPDGHGELTAPGLTIANLLRACAALITAASVAASMLGRETRPFSPPSSYMILIKSEPSAMRASTQPTPF